MPSPITKIFVRLNIGYDKNIVQRKNEQYAPRSKRSVQGILDVHNIEAPDMLLSVHDDTSSAHIPSTRDHHNVTRIKLDVVCDLSILQIELDGVVDVDERVGIPDGPAVVGDNVRDALGADGHFSDFEEFVGCFFWGDAVDGEAAFDIVEETEVFA
jgi:hypothetical protein